MYEPKSAENQVLVLGCGRVGGVMWGWGWWSDPKSKLLRFWFWYF